MGVYLNGKGAYGLFREEFSLTYFVDKTEIIDDLVPLLELKKTLRRNQAQVVEKILNAFV